MKKANKIASIVVNYKRISETLKAVDSLNKQKGNLDQVIIVIDNNSKDDSVSKLRTLKNIILIENHKNIGFAAANNQGIKIALKKKLDYVFLLNDDAWLDSNCLNELIEGDKDIISPKIYFVPGFEFHKKRYKKSDLGKVIWYAGGKIDWNNIYANHVGVDILDNNQFNKLKPTDFTTGCAMLIKTDVFQKIGLFDEKYFMYWEDVDLCQRARKKGLTVFYNGFAKAWHKNLGTQLGITSEQKEKQMARSRLRFGLKFANLKTKTLLLKDFLSKLFS